MASGRRKVTVNNLRHDLQRITFFAPSTVASLLDENLRTMTHCW